MIQSSFLIFTFHYDKYNFHFAGMEIREVDTSLQSSEDKIPYDSAPLHKKLIIEISKISENLQLSSLFSPESNTSRKKLINFILPLSGRFSTFKRFMDVYEEICIKENQPTRLIVVLYTGDQYEDSLSLINDIQMKYKTTEIKVKTVRESFARGRAMHYGIAQVPGNELLFLIDVDIVFNTKSLLRIRQNTHRNVSVYFPIVYSLYNPEMFNKTYDVNNINALEKELILNEDNGLWRQFGFGIVSLYKSDFLKLGGFDESIDQWGLEDVNLYDNVVKSDLKIVRSVDTGLIHVYHPIECVDNLGAAQKIMCLGTKANIAGSMQDLQKYYLKNKLPR